MSKFLKIAGIATLVAVVGAVVVGAVAFAQDPPRKPPFPGAMLRHGPFGGERGGFPGGPLGITPEQAQAYQEQMGEALAGALGMSAEELQAAIAEGQTPCQIVEAQGLDPAEVWAATEDARQDLLQQAVEDGLLTQNQADWIGQRMSDHDMSQWCDADGPPGFLGSMRGRRPFGPMGVDSEQAQAYREQTHAAVAEALGLSVEELDAAIAEGQTLAEIAEAQGVDLQAVHDTMAADRQEMMRQAIEQAVEDGQMDREQADWLLQGLEQGWMGGRGFRGHGFGPEGQDWPHGPGFRHPFAAPGQ
jgi:hypothetical protein